MENPLSSREKDPVMSYLICATPCSGSTLLCDVLDAGGSRDQHQGSALPKRPARHRDLKRTARIPGSEA